MSFPTVSFRVAFGTAALAGTPAWTDLSADVMQYSYRRGRQYEIDRFEPGEAEITLRNLAGDYWPNNGNSPYSGNIRPNVQIDLNALFGAPEVASYNRFHGVVESWQYGYRNQEGTTVPIVTLRAVEATKLLARADLGGTSYAQQNSGTRVAAVADTATWPTNKRSINSGQSTIQASGTIDANTGAADHLNEVVLSEFGSLYQEADMTLRYLDRHARLKTPFLASQGTIGVTASDWPYREPQFQYDDQHILNDVTIIRSTGGTKTASDATSQGRYGIRSLTRTILVTADNEAQSQADYLNSRFKEPSLRIKSVTVKANVNPDNVFAALLARDISDRITVKLPSGSVNEDYFIEGVEESVEGRDWTTRFSLSPVADQLYWTLGVAGQTELGQTTRLAY